MYNHHFRYSFRLFLLYLFLLNHSYGYIPLCRKCHRQNDFATKNRALHLKKLNYLHSRLSQKSINLEIVLRQGIFKVKEKQFNFSSLSQCILCGITTDSVTVFWVY